MHASLSPLCLWLDWRRGGGGHSRHPVRLQPRQHVAGETFDLIHEHRVRHCTAIQAHRHLVRAGVVGRGNDAFGDLVRRAPWLLLGNLADAVHGHTPVALATARYQRHVFRPQIVVRGIRDVATFSLQVALGDVAMAEQGAIEIVRIRAGFFDGLLFGVGYVDVGLNDQVARRDLMAVLVQLFGVVADHVLAHTAVARDAGRDRNIVLPRPLDRLFARGHGHPDRRVRLLHRPGPDGDVLVVPEPPLVREHFVGPREANNLPRFFEPGARLALRDVEDVVLARNTPRKAADDATVGQAV